MLCSFFSGAADVLLICFGSRGPASQGSLSVVPLLLRVTAGLVGKPAVGHAGDLFTIMQLLQQTVLSPFLAQDQQPAWARVLEFFPERGAPDLTAYLQEVTTKRHRLYVIRCTVRLHANYYHLRLAGLLPVRNKMLWCHRIVDPPCYRVVDIPLILQRSVARLSDRTVIYPFATGHDALFLSLSGFLMACDTHDQKYVLHEHLKNMGLAGPPAPVLPWGGRFREEPDGSFVLPFRSLKILPAELLAIPVPNKSLAFDERPVMSLDEWEEYRKRITSTVLLTSLEEPTDPPSSTFHWPGWLSTGTLYLLTKIWQARCLSIGGRPRWSTGEMAFGFSTVLHLGDLPHLPTAAKCDDRSAFCISSDAPTSSTELRPVLSLRRKAISAAKHVCTYLLEILVESRDLANTKIHRPTVSIKGCIPKGPHVYPFSGM